MQLVENFETKESFKAAVKSGANLVVVTHGAVRADTIEIEVQHPDGLWFARVRVRSGVILEVIE